MLRRIVDYYTIVVPMKSTAEVDADQWILTLSFDGGATYYSLEGVRFHRWWLVLASCVAHLAAGSLPAFHSLQDPLDIYLDHAHATIERQSYLWLGISTALVGPWIERHGPRTGMALGTLLVAVGYLVSHFAIRAASPTLVVFGLGGCSGAGFGFVLISSTAAVLKWFPDLRGVVTGLGLSSFVLGHVGWSYVYKTTFHDMNNMPQLFWTTGGLFASIKAIADWLTLSFVCSLGLALVPTLALATLVMRSPPPTFVIHGLNMHGVAAADAPDATLVHVDFHQVGLTLVNDDVVAHMNDDGARPMDKNQEYATAQSLLQCLASTDFVIFSVAVVAGFVPAMLLLSNAHVLAIVHLVTGKDPTMETRSLLDTHHLVVMAAGSLLLPLLSDVCVCCATRPVLVRKIGFLILLVSQLVVVARLPTLLMADGLRWSFLVLVFCSGGALALAPSFLTDLFGVFHVGTMYGLVLTAWAFGPVVVTSVAPTPASLQAQLASMVVLLACGVVAIILVRTDAKDRFYRGYQVTLCGNVVVQCAACGSHPPLPRASVDKTRTDQDHLDVTILDRPEHPASHFALWQVRHDPTTGLSPSTTH
ncbi:Aste57867_8142 [Aphanomyces stellatus]|uniref:Aste57867_8142 protein n=1 Tax=Aphanomyces stellatus TaxID=120398 RepID=A0A485KJJ1_9STRA|nr:hypothetical protein As57867_008112 [Aphanomyces stellatus]VFT85031.1 Aste57867_8142 [Aphanomyces stellatus]